VRYLRPSDVIHAHELATGEEFDPSGFSFAELEIAVLRPQEGSRGGYEAYQGVHEKAAAIFVALVQHEPFPKKNRGTAVLAVHAFYGLNGYALDITDDELLDMAHMAVDRQITIVDAAVRFGRCAVEFPDPD
jgi:death-on-curing protein